MLENILTLLSTLVGGGLLGILFERKKRRVETEAIEAEVIDRIQNIYNKFLEDYMKKLRNFSMRIKNLRRK